MLTAAIVPLMLLSGDAPADVDGPARLDVLSHTNPLRYVVDAVRALFLGHYTAATVWQGALVAVFLVVGCLTRGTRRFLEDDT